MGLIAHYRLDGDATDAIGDRDGVVNGSPSWVTSKLGQGMKSDGTSTGGYITQSSVSDYLHGRPEASISMWVKKDATQYGFFQLSGFKNSNGNLYPYNSSTRVYLDTFRTNRLGPISMHSSVLEWHHFCVTQKPGEWNLYQNGELVHSAGADSQVSTDYLQFEIGRNSGNRYADAQFDDVRIYDHALSPREVRDLSLGLVGHYPLVHDATNAAGHNSGILNGSVAFSDEMGGSAEFDNNSYIQLETGITGDPDELSASFWAKADALQSYDGLIQFDGVGGDHNDGFVITVASSTTMRFRYWTDGGTNITWPARGFSSGKESHFCVTLKGKLFTVYQDGEKVGEHVYSNPLTLTGGVKLGLYTWQNNYFTGWIKDARIYATALTAAQVKELYQQRASIDSEGSVHTVLLQELSSNKVPPFSDWTLGQGVTLISENEIQVDAANTTISSPTFPVNGASSGYFSAEFWSDVPSERESFAPNAGWYVGTAYYDATGNRSANTGGHNGNGNARMYPLGKWERMIWRHSLGNAITHCSLDIRASTAYTPPSFRVRNVMWTPYHPGDREPTPYHAGNTTDTEAPVNAVSSEGALVAAVSEAGVTRGLVAWYPLIGDTKDYAGTNHAVNNGAVATAEGYAFDGTSHMVVDTPVDTTKSLSMSYRVYWNGTEPFQVGYGGSSIGRLHTGYQSSSQGFLVGLGDSFTYVRADFKPNNWHYLTIVGDTTSF